ncbi:MAG: GGDEF domain-containing protein [Bacillota bacterium]
MQLFNLIDINIYAMAILIYILVSTLNRGGLRLVHDRLFIWMILSAIAILLFDAGAWVFNTLPGEGAWLGNAICNIMLFALSPVPVALWYLYSDYQIFQDEKRIKNSFVIIGILLITNIVLSILSPFLNLYFTINEGNAFQRGPIGFYLLFILLTLGFLLFVSIKIIIYRKRIEKHNFAAMLLFALPPFIGSLLQILFYGISFLWSCAALSLLFVFISIQNHRLNSDPLTGAYNRRQLDLFIRSRIRQSDNARFAGMMLDLNGFKQINDSFGHAEGDCALEDTVHILRQCLRAQDRIFRYGGDEFVVIMEISAGDVLASIVQRVYAGFKQYNASSGKPYKLEPSIGYMQYDKRSDMNPDEFIDMLDASMYREKNAIKALIPEHADKKS